MKYVEVSVTETDIMFGKKGSCTQCPIAYAVKRATGRKRNVVVDGQYLTINPDRPCEQEMHLPKKARDFVIKFDSGKKVKPFKFGIPMDMVKQ